MKGCPGEEGDDEIEQKLLIAKEQRLVETPYLHREVVRLVDREFIEGKAIQTLGNIIKPHPLIKHWNTQYGSTCFIFTLLKLTYEEKNVELDFLKFCT
jgi:hypothetical protein